MKRRKATENSQDILRLGCPMRGHVQRTEKKWFDYPETIFLEHERYKWKETEKTNEDKLPKKLRNGWK